MVRWGKAGCWGIDPLLSLQDLDAQRDTRTEYGHTPVPPFSLTDSDAVADHCYGRHRRTSQLCMLGLF